jgi:hypothetical protein
MFRSLRDVAVSVLLLGCALVRVFRYGITKSVASFAQSMNELSPTLHPLQEPHNAVLTPLKQRA